MKFHPFQVLLMVLLSWTLQSAMAQGNADTNPDNKNHLIISAEGRILSAIPHYSPDENILIEITGVRHPDVGRYEIWYQYMDNLDQPYLLPDPEEVSKEKAIAPKGKKISGRNTSIYRTIPSAANGQSGFLVYNIVKTPGPVEMPQQLKLAKDQRWIKEEWQKSVDTLSLNSLVFLKAKQIFDDSLAVQNIYNEDSMLKSIKAQIRGAIAAQQRRYLKIDKLEYEYDSLATRVAYFKELAAFRNQVMGSSHGLETENEKHERFKSWKDAKAAEVATKKKLHEKNLEYIKQMESIDFKPNNDATAQSGTSAQNSDKPTTKLGYNIHFNKEDFKDYKDSASPALDSLVSLATARKKVLNQSPEVIELKAPDGSLKVQYLSYLTAKKQRERNDSMGTTKKQVLRVGVLVLGKDRKTISYEVSTYMRDSQEMASLRRMGGYPILEQDDEPFVLICNHRYYREGKLLPYFLDYDIVKDTEPIDIGFRPFLDFEKAVTEERDLKDNPPGPQREITSNDHLDWSNAYTDILLPFGRTFPKRHCIKAKIGGPILQNNPAASGTVSADDSFLVVDKYPAIRGLDRFGMHTGVVGSIFSMPSYEKILVRPDDPLTNETDPVYRIGTRNESQSSFLPFVGFSYHFKKVDIKRPIRYPDALIPAFTLGIDYLKLGKSFFPGLSWEFARHVHLTAGAHFQKIPFLQDHGQNLNTESPPLTSEKWRCRGVVLGVSFNFNLVTSIFPTYRSEKVKLPTTD